MNEDFHSGFRIGLFAGACAAFLAALVHINLGKEDCERDLPGSQECKLTWVIEVEK